MNFYSRNDSLNFGYALSREKSKGPLSYFFLLSAIGFGSIRSMATRFALKKFDPVAMKRPLLMSEPGDRVFVPAGTADRRTMADNYDFARSLYLRAGIEPGEFVPFTGNPYARIRQEAQNGAIATVIYSPGLHKIFRDARLMEAVKVLNNKLACMDYLNGQGVELPKYVNLSEPVTARKLKNALLEVGTPCYIKCGIGNGGNHVWRIDDLSELKRLPKKTLSGGYQIQEALPGPDSFNIQYLILPDRVVRKLSTRQRIGHETIHAGNDWPVAWSNGAYADRIARACQRLGYVGVLGLDMKDRLLEVNARQNSSCIMPALLERVPDVEKLSISINHRKKSARLADLLPDELWYRNGKGLLPYSWHDGPGRVFVAIINDIDGSMESTFSRICPQI
jgi:hypothetical protein